MRSSRGSARSVAAISVGIFIAIAGAAYPFAIYFYGDRIRPAVFIAGAMALTALQLAILRSPVARLWRVPLLFSALLTIAIMLLDQSFAKQAYPVVRSLGAAAVFAWSLISPPSLIERFARLRYSSLPPEATPYCRNVTIIWVIWLILNAIIAASLALSGDLKIWALWTGAISYGISGSLFLGEFAYRLLVLQKRAGL